ncbi:MAG TPA: hypothetical protein VF178_06290 [Gemmatimonadaceae bacterium]
MSARKSGRGERARRDPESATRERDVPVPVERDVVLEDSDDSFPASDPPGWIAMRLGPPLGHEDQQRDAPRS